jgi:hypothetical protein
MELGVSAVRDEQERGFIEGGGDLDVDSLEAAS